MSALEIEASSLGEQCAYEVVGLFSGAFHRLDALGLVGCACRAIERCGIRRMPRNAPRTDAASQALDGMRRLPPGLDVRRLLQLLQMETRSGSKQLQQRAVASPVAERAACQMHEIDRPPRNRLERSIVGGLGRRLASGRRFHVGATRRNQ